MQFVNKLRYAKEGARDIMDRACADLPWQVWLEVDGKDIDIPKVSYSNETTRVSPSCLVCYYRICLRHFPHYCAFLFSDNMEVPTITVEHIVLGKLEHR